jgi:hypothetical protein
MPRPLCWLLPFLLLACAGRRIAPADPTEAPAWLQARPMPAALRGEFNVSVKGPSLEGSTGGALIVQGPDRLRLDVLTPLSTPLLYVATDGRSLHAWSQRDATFYRGDQAVEVLEALAGGGVGVDDVVSLLTGGLPLSEARVISAVEEAEGVRVQLEAPQGLRLTALIDDRERVVTELLLEREGQVAAKLRVPDRMRVGRLHLPEELVLELPLVGWTIEIEYHTWEQLGRVPDVFTLVAPPSSAQRDLVESLKALREKASGPPP